MYQDLTGAAAGQHRAQLVDDADLARLAGQAAHSRPLLGRGARALRAWAQHGQLGAGYVAAREDQPTPHGYFRSRP